MSNLNRNNAKKVISKLELQIKRKLGGYFWGKHLSLFKGQSMNFKNIRQYTPGDEVRHIDWKVTARTNKVHVKEFEQESELEVYVIVDLSSSMYFGHENQYKSDQVYNLVNLIVQLLIKEGDSFGMIFANNNKLEVIKPKKGYAQLKVALNKMSKVIPAIGRYSLIEQALDKLNTWKKKPGGVIIISDFLEQLEQSHSFMREVKKLSFKNEILIMQVLDPFEVNPGKQDELNYYDLETGLEKKLSLSQAEADRYAENVTKLITNFHLQLRKMDIRSAVIWDNADAIKAIIELINLNHKFQKI